MIKAIRGFKDVLPEEMPYWRLLEEEARKILEAYGYREIRIPVLEKLNLFERSIGTATDIVEKEMYAFEDKGGDWVAMRPEATACIARAYIEHALHLKDPLGKFFFIGPMFRHERPQAGRLRQFHQIDVEVFGVKSPSLDAEVIALLFKIADKMGITDGLTMEVNHIGCKKCRPVYRKLLIGYLEDKKEALCKDCKRRLERNPLRILDCKKSNCKEITQRAPRIIDCLCNSCKEYFEKTREYLDICGIPYIINPLIVRGLDYYTGVVFELTTTELGAQGAVAAGGRYDDLVEELGGPPTPGIGFAIGEERFIAMMKKRTIIPEKTPKAMFCLLGEEAKKACIPYVLELRDRGYWIEMEHEDKSLKAQMRKANKLGVKFTFIVGEDELKEKIAIVRDMVEKRQFSIKLCIEEIVKILEGAR